MSQEQHLTPLGVEQAEVLARYLSRFQFHALSHGPVVAGYLAHLAGTPRDFFIYPRLTSISRVLAGDATRVIDFVNAPPHFESP